MSPRTCTDNLTDHQDDPPSTPTGSLVKTVYLIRHAHSEENRRIGSLKKVWQSISSFSIPKQKDLCDGIEWFNIPAQLDSPVSKRGALQIETMAAVLSQAQFVNQIQLVAHSPLQRARDTSRGLLGCLATEIANRSVLSAPMPPFLQAGQVQRVVELPLLEEKTPAEWVVGTSFSQRIQALERWLDEQPEQHIALVGHSQFFRAMLQTNFLFGNCDVWRVTYQSTPTATSTTSSTSNTATFSKWSELQKLHTCTLPEHLLAALEGDDKSSTRPPPTEEDDDPRDKRA